MDALRILGAVMAALVFASCLSPPAVNSPIDDWDPVAATAESQIASDQRSGEILLVLTLSGGGTRAAAFAYGALRGLAESRLMVEGRERRLLDEVDIISAVSGGSFAAAYFGLRGEGIFDDFEEVFLRKNVQGGLIFEMLRPANWPYLLRSDRSQLAARYYDRKIFRGATFADLKRPGAPEVILNATNLATAGRFSFSMPWFGLICSDLDGFPVSQAVTASSAVPIVFPTIRLRNYAGRCGFRPPEWIEEPVDGEVGIRRLAREELRAAYSGAEGGRYVHLLDGGLSDNLGLRNAVGALMVAGNAQRAMQEIRHQETRVILVVTVNAETPLDSSWARVNRAASAVQVVNGLSSAQIHRTNRVTVELAQQAFARWSRELSSPEVPVVFEFVEVSFAAIADPEERAYLAGIETSFKLNDEKVDRLIAAGRRLVLEAPGLERAREALTAQPTHFPHH
jgi:NTE family protein